MLDLDHPLYNRAPRRWIHEYSTVNPVEILKISSSVEVFCIAEAFSARLNSKCFLRDHFLAVCPMPTTGDRLLDFQSISKVRVIHSSGLVAILIPFKHLKFYRGRENVKGLLDTQNSIYSAPNSIIHTDNRC